MLCKLRDVFQLRENFILFFINSDLSLNQTQILAQKLTPNLTFPTTQTLILTLKKPIEKCMDKFFSFSFL